MVDDPPHCPIIPTECEVKHVKIYVIIYYLILSPFGDAGPVPVKQILRRASVVLCHHPHFFPADLHVMTKFILVSGGVVSGIGKGVIGMRIQLHHHNV